MKKLALALMCLVSVAFFASCTPDVENPEPSIAVFVGSEGYLYDGAVVDVNVEYPFAFRAASNAETQKDLASFKIYIDDELQLDSVISGKEFQFSGTFSYEYRDIIDQTSIKAVVTDVAGKMNTATIDLSINQPAVELEVKDITWVRRGSNSLNADEMAACGLKWVARDAFHANIQPLNENCELYVVENNAEAYNAVTTDLEKAAYFAQLIETGRPVDEYRNISTSQDGEYNDILAVIDANGEQHLILFIKASVETGSFGTQTSITGKVK